MQAAGDLCFPEGESRASGTVYLSGAAHQRLLAEAYTQFTLTNPMHADVFPSVRQMESEVVAMTAALLGGGRSGDPGVCGAMTSGGTESIQTAVKASRDYMAARRGITEPEMVVADSAHAAFVKAAEYFKVRLVRVAVGPDWRLAGAAVAAAVGRNTVLVVASAPGFPHGVVDHVEDIAKARARCACALPCPAAPAAPGTAVWRARCARCARVRVAPRRRASAGWCACARARARAWRPHPPSRPLPSPPLPPTNSKQIRR